LHEVEILKTVTKVALGVLATSIALLIILPGNAPGGASVPQSGVPETARDETPAKASTAPAGAHAAAAGTSDLDCDLAAVRAREFIAGRDKGNPEDWALTLLRERGEFSFGFVVDGVYHGPPDTPAAITVADVIASCRRVNETGALY